MLWLFLLELYVLRFTNFHFKTNIWNIAVFHLPNDWTNYTLQVYTRFNLVMGLSVLSASKLNFVYKARRQVFSQVSRAEIIGNHHLPKPTFTPDWYPDALPKSPHAPQLNPNFLSLQKHATSDWVRVWFHPKTSRHFKRNLPWIL